MADSVRPIVPDQFPQELQRYIFEVAARKFPSTAIQLVRVANHVRIWIEPILYECIIVRNDKCCLKLLETLSARPELFLSHTRQIGLVTDTVTFGQAKTILATCSHRTTEFSVWSGQRNPSIFLPFIRSHGVRRLTLQSHHSSELTIPPSILSSLTHLMMLDGPYSWFSLRQAAHEVREAEVIHESHVPPPLSRSPSSSTVSPTPVKPFFQSLTHFGVCSQNWGSAQPILKVAENLKYFAVIVPPAPKCTARSVAMIEQRIRELRDPRVVLVQYDHTVENWETAARGGRDIWELVEKLVEDRYKNAGNDWIVGAQRARGWSFSSNA